MEAILAILSVLLVISIFTNVILRLRLKKLKEDLDRKKLVNNCLEVMINNDSKLISVEFLNTMPLVDIKKYKKTITSHYRNCLKQTEVLDLGFYLEQVNGLTITDRKNCLMFMLYDAGEQTELEICSKLLVQAIILENKLQEESDLNKIAELIGFVITISNQQGCGEELIKLFEAETKKTLDRDCPNEALRNKIEVAMMRVCVSLDVNI